MLQVKQITNSLFSSNTYVIFDDEYDYCWLVDIGDFQKVADVIPIGVKIKGVFLTHTHFDHIYGLNDLYNKFPHIKVYTNKYGRDALYNEKKNFSLYHEMPFAYKGSDVALLEEGHCIELYPGILIRAYATPGHCPSCLTYVINEYIFTGDSYIPGIKVVTKLPGGNRIVAKESVSKIMTLSQNRIICPGHGDMIV